MAHHFGVPSQQSSQLTPRHPPLSHQDRCHQSTRSRRLLCPATSAKVALRDGQFLTNRGQEVSRCGPSFELISAVSNGTSRSTLEGFLLPRNRLPPAQVRAGILRLSHVPSGVHASLNRRQIGSAGHSATFVKAEQRVIHIDQRSAHAVHNLLVAAVRVRQRIVNNTRPHRVEVDVEHNLREVPLRVDQPRLVPTVPEASRARARLVEHTAENALKRMKARGEIDG